MHPSDPAIRHQIFIQRYASGLGTAFGVELARTYQTVIELIEEGGTDRRVAQLNQILIDLEQLIAGTFNSAKTAFILELDALAQAEAAWSKQLLINTSTAIAPALPDITQLQAAYKIRKFEATPNSRVNIEEALKQFEQGIAKAIRFAIRDGVVLGETTEAIAEKLAVQQIVTKHKARALARTMTNHVSNVARSSVMAANDDIVKSYQWLATLDSRTTLVCAGRDGNVYPVSSDSPRPPAHWNCRSTTIPVIEPEYDIGGGQGRRPSENGDVSESTNFGQWLKRQPAGFQDEYFSRFTNGEEKAKLFRKGGLKIDRFTDAKGAEYSLIDLGRLYPLEFQRSGIT